LQRHHDQPRPAIRPHRQRVRAVEPIVELLEPIPPALALPAHAQPDHVARVSTARRAGKRHPLTTDEPCKLPLRLHTLAPLTPAHRITPPQAVPVLATAHV